MNPICKQCGKREVEDARVCYATPVCFKCLPPPDDLPIREVIKNHCPICGATTTGLLVPKKSLRDSRVIDTLKEMF